MFSASFFRVEKYFILILVTAGIIIFIINYKNKKIVVASVAVLFLTLGIWRTSVSLDKAKDNLTNSKLGPAEFTGIVSKEPETDEKYQKVIVKDNEKNKILINSDIYPQYQYGDELKIKCILQEPKNFEDSNFDYQMYFKLFLTFNVRKLKDSREKRVSARFFWYRYLTNYLFSNIIEMKLYFKSQNRNE